MSRARIRSRIDKVATGNVGDFRGQTHGGVFKRRSRKWIRKEWWNGKNWNENKNGETPRRLGRK